MTMCVLRRTVTRPLNNGRQYSLLQTPVLKRNSSHGKITHLVPDCATSYATRTPEQFMAARFAWAARRVCLS